MAAKANIEYFLKVQRELPIYNQDQPGAGKPDYEVIKLSTGKQAPVVYRLVLDSVGAASYSGNTWTFNVNLPHDATQMRFGEGVLNVESFWVDMDENLTLSTSAYHVSMPEMVHRRSFHTGTGSLTPILFTTRGYSFEPSTTYTGTIVGGNILNSSILTVRMTSATNKALTWDIVNNRWSMTLSISFPRDE